MPPRYLDIAETKRLCPDMDKSIDLMTSHFGLYHNGNISIEPKTLLTPNGDERTHGRLIYGGCHLKWNSHGYYVTKSVTSKNDLSKTFGSRGESVFTVFDSETARLLAVVEGGWLTKVRTGAISGLATHYLANSDAETIGIIGTGNYAQHQIEALYETLKNISLVKCHSKTSAGRTDFVHTMEKYPELKVEDSLRKTIEDSDIIITITTADEPLVKYDWLKRGSLMIHAGSYREEDDNTILKSDKLIVTNWNHTIHRGTSTVAQLHQKGLLDYEHIDGEMEHLVMVGNGRREYDHEKIFFLSNGMVSQDAMLILEMLSKE
jgi:ornithine cyclodeaminase/alanine dehydrogenase-like protein (mu-crystallin family)